MVYSANMCRTIYFQSMHVSEHAQENSANVLFFFFSKCTYQKNRAEINKLKGSGQFYNVKRQIKLKKSRKKKIMQPRGVINKIGKKKKLEKSKAA